jgi:hypothetical protein
MKKPKIILLSAILAGSLFAGGKAALALDYGYDHGYGWRGGEIRRDYLDVEQLKRRLFRDQLELRRDLRNGAGPAEIAFDRRQIARDRRVLAEADAELEHGRGYGWRDSNWNRW